MCGARAWRGDWLSRAESLAHILHVHISQVGLQVQISVPTSDTEEAGGAQHGHEVVVPTHACSMPQRAAFGDVQLLGFVSAPYLHPCCKCAKPSIRLLWREAALMGASADVESVNRMTHPVPTKINFKLRAYDVEYANILLLGVG